MALAYSKKLPEDIRKAYVIDLFCGCGGMSYGFYVTRQSHMAFEVLAGVDIDEKMLETYSANIDVRTVNMDIRDIESEPQKLQETVPEFNPDKCRPLVFIGCAPCQGFSAHRKKDKRDDPRNSLLMSFANICEEFRPDVILMENVPEVLTGKYREYFKAAAHKLEGLGYQLTLDIIDMSLYGLPQRRKRAIAIGGLGRTIALPDPIFKQESALTVRHAIGHLSPIESGQVDPYDPVHRAPDHTTEILRRIRKTPKDGGDRRSLSSDEQLRCHSSIDNGNTPGFTDVYGRLRWDTPSVTITAKSSTPSCGRFIHPDQNRNISVREAAILQGFPQSYQFRGSLVHQYRQIGEAVPPLFARFLAWQVLDSFKPKIRIPKRLFESPENWLSRTSQSTSSNRKLKVVDLFCGAGGLALGFKKAGYETTFASDIDPDCQKTFRKNISDNCYRLDIRSPETIRGIIERIDKFPFVVVGGPPCQGFSQQRRGEDLDPRNNLVVSYAELIRKLRHRPIAVVLENVIYLDSPRGRKVFEEYQEILKVLRYEIFRHDLNSADFAVPQLRKRIIIVAIDKRLAAFYGSPHPLTGSRWPTIGEVFSGLIGSEAARDLFSVMLPNNQHSLEGEQNRKRIAYVDMGFGRLSIPPNLQLDCHAKYGGHLDVYGRLDWFSQARTITGGFDSFTRGEYAHPYFHRSITPREAARIQGFPDWFVFEGNKASVRRQIGNAVPPPLAYSLAKEILKAYLKSGIQKEKN